MSFKNKTVRVNTMYGADGRLRTSYLDGNAAKVARKNVKAFDKTIAKYEKDFASYASLDIETAKIYDVNTKYIFGKMNIAEKYVNYVPVEDMADSLGDEMTAIAGSKHSKKLGVGSKIASKFQPFFEKQAQKHPKLQKLSDRVTKAANGGRMPLTADSAAMMRIAFDKKYYNDCRMPGADREQLRQQYERAIDNLANMAKFDGVEPQELSDKFSEKLITQMRIDESLTDIYDGMATGSIRLAEDKPVMNTKGEPVKINGKTLYEQASGFVSAEKDKHGKPISLDAWDFKPREPQTIEDILCDYQNKLDTYAKSCKTEADFKRMLASNSYQNLERNAKVFAEADCPDEAARFKYEFARTNLQSCKEWAVNNGSKSSLARLVIPPSYETYIKGNEFFGSYATDDYYDINGQTEVYDKAAKEVTYLSDDGLAEELTSKCMSDSQEMSDHEKMNERCNILEAENATLREELAKREEQRQKEEAAKVQLITDDKTATLNSGADKSSVDKEAVIGKGNRFKNFMSGLSSAAVLAMSVKQSISERYGDSKTILKVDGKQSPQLEDSDVSAIETTADVEIVSEPKIEAKVVGGEDLTVGTSGEPKDTVVRSAARFAISDNIVQADSDMSAEPDY